MLATLETLSTMSSLLGVVAGGLAISLALYIQLVKRYAIAIPYTLAMYVIGAVLLFINLDLETGFHTPLALELAVLLTYATVIVVELALFYDVRTRYSRFVSLIERFQETWEAEQDE